VPLRDSSGELLGAVIVCRDITKVKEEEFFRARPEPRSGVIAADAPLSDVLTNLVLLMEAQAEGLRCSVLLLSRDGEHPPWSSAESPEAYVKAVDACRLDRVVVPAAQQCLTRRAVIVTDVYNRSALG
jgi:hypothetical protein